MVLCGSKNLHLVIKNENITQAKIEPRKKKYSFNQDCKQPGALHHALKLAYLSQGSG